MIVNHETHSLPSFKIVNCRRPAVRLENMRGEKSNDNSRRSTGHDGEGIPSGDQWRNDQELCTGG